MDANSVQPKGLNKKQFYFEHIKRWQGSNLSQEQYCKKYGIKLANLFYWRKKYLENEEKPISDKAFTQLKIKEMPVSNVALTRRPWGDSLVILLPNGIEIMFPIAIEDNRIINLIQSLRGALC